MTEVEERFWAKVDAEGICWEWTAARNNKGYGVFAVHRKNGLAHRFAYQTLVGPVSDGLELDHLCRNKTCVNPDHLEPVTCRVNNLRAGGVSGLNSRKTHCPQGHAYDRANGRRRTCSTCRREYQWAYTAKRKEGASC